MSVSAGGRGPAGFTAGGMCCTGRALFAGGGAFGRALATPLGAPGAAPAPRRSVVVDPTVTAPLDDGNSADAMGAVEAVVVALVIEGAPTLDEGRASVGGSGCGV